jgi:hypothetical protein
MQKVIVLIFQERVSNYSPHGFDAVLKYTPTSNGPQHLALIEWNTLSDEILR